MSDLFVAADRLTHKATDHEGILSIVEATDLAERMRLPYGFAKRDWKVIVGHAGSLRDLIEDDDAADEDIKTSAGVLRSALRPYV